MVAARCSPGRHWVGPVLHELAYKCSSLCNCSTSSTVGRFYLLECPLLDYWKLANEWPWSNCEPACTEWLQRYLWLNFSVVAPCPTSKYTLKIASFTGHPQILSCSCTPAVILLRMAWVRGYSQLWRKLGPGGWGYIANVSIVWNHHRLILQ